MLETKNAHPPNRLARYQTFPSANVRGVRTPNHRFGGMIPIISGIAIALIIIAGTKNGCSLIFLPCPSTLAICTGSA